MIYKNKTLTLLGTFVVIFFSCITYAAKINTCANNKESEFNKAVKDFIAYNKNNKGKFPINDDINPCDDFYDYACSIVTNNQKLKDGDLEYSAWLTESYNRFFDIKKKYLTDLLHEEPESEMEKEIKNFYASWTNPAVIAKNEIAFVNKTKETLDKINTKDEFIDMLATNIMKLYFINFHSGNAHLVFKTKLTYLPIKQLYDNKAISKDIKALIKAFFVAIEENSPEEKTNWVYKFEKSLIDEGFHHNSEDFTPITPKKLSENIPSTKLQEFLNSLPAETNIAIEKNVVRFFKKNWDNISLEELKAIFLWLQLKQMMSTAYPSFFKHRQMFYKNLFGVEPPSLEKKMLERTIENFSKELDFILLPKLFPDFPKEKIVKLAEKIKQTLIKQIKNSEWLNNPVARSNTIRLLEKNNFRIAYPNNEEEWGFNLITNYAINKPIENFFKFKQISQEKILKNSDKTHKTSWLYSPLSNQASYTSSSSLTIPMTNLQHPLYDQNEADEINLGAIGMFIGHELFHTIQRTDQNMDLWKEKPLKNEKLINQFNEAGINGKRTLHENLADLAGLNTAYETAFPGGKGEQDLKKRFFLQYARAWCEKKNKVMRNIHHHIDAHSPGNARVNEQLKHQQGFKEAYNCKTGDPMILPESEIIRVWGNNLNEINHPQVINQ